MRVNIYAEELTDRVELVTKAIDTEDGRVKVFTGVRLYLYLPVTQGESPKLGGSVRGPFLHHPGDDDSAAITIWGADDQRGKLQMRDIFQKMMDALK